MPPDNQNIQDKYNSLLKENQRLKEENARLRELLPVEEKNVSTETEIASGSVPNMVIEPEEQSHTEVSNSSSPAEKIALYMSLFKGRDDVFAQRWENTKKGTAGYSPACKNEWAKGLCQKPKKTCSVCLHKEYMPLTDKVIENHLRGNSIVGLYPLLTDETCLFLAIDFDDEGWEKDITTLRQTCAMYAIPIAIERSRSGNGAHAWFFFDLPISAYLARKFGSALLTNAMSRKHDISFSSYDRLFPNQDTMPKGGLGNLIALPLQKVARANDNSVFIDENFIPFPDQWAFLSSIIRLEQEQVESLLSVLAPVSELGELRIVDDEEQKPWEKPKAGLKKEDFPHAVNVTKANMLYIPKTGFSQKALNSLKRVAAFKNPEFFKAQAMRLSTFGKPRIISCADETTEFICLPRGCENELTEILRKNGIETRFTDETNHGKEIQVTFNGLLRDDQPQAAQSLLEKDNGILCGTTAFGKTVVAINLIAQRKVNTLILVTRINLLSQWREKIDEFLVFQDFETNGKTASKSHKQGFVGQFGGGKKALTGIVDIAVMQSVVREGIVDECVRNYGMVIVDECHHVSAFSFEQILKSTNARYVYGLTATPARKDGHHPIITMQCGPIRFRDDAKAQADNRPFDHFIVPRFTSFRATRNDEKETTITELYSQITDDAFRNSQIIEDVLQSYSEGRNCIVITERTTHVKILVHELEKHIENVVLLTGTLSAKAAREAIAKISDTTDDSPLLIVATGRYIGEGFDVPKLDTLFLAMPISWKGTLQQYAGRLHRLCDGKKEVIVYDYIDIHEKMFEKMYQKRLVGYASIGYNSKCDIKTDEPSEIIFDKDSFQHVFANDLAAATQEILIVSPFLKQSRVSQTMKILERPMVHGVNVSIITRPATDDNTATKNLIEHLKDSGFEVITKPGIHQKFAIIDRRIVWYGSINLLSYGHSEESIMRFVSRNIALELLKTV